jgi:hypothetical protein
MMHVCLCDVVTAAMALCAHMEQGAIPVHHRGRVVGLLGGVSRAGAGVTTTAAAAATHTYIHHTFDIVTERPCTHAQLP